MDSNLCTSVLILVEDHATKTKEVFKIPGVVSLALNRPGKSDAKIQGKTIAFINIIKCQPS